MNVRKFNYNNMEDIAKAEELKFKLENKCISPNVYLLGFNTLVIEWWLYYKNNKSQEGNTIWKSTQQKNKSYTIH